MSGIALSWVLLGGTLLTEAGRYSTGKSITNSEERLRQSRKECHGVHHGVSDLIKLGLTEPWSVMVRYLNLSIWSLLLLIDCIELSDEIECSLHVRIAK